MSTHCGYITTLKNIRKHPNASRKASLKVFRIFFIYNTPL